VAVDWPFGGVVGVWGMGGRWFVARGQEQRNNPVNRRLQGIVGGVGVVGGCHSRWSGRLGVSWTWKWWGWCFVAREHEK
jgi:hypothetical protein